MNTDVHNLLRLTKECKVKLSDDQITFFAQMNQFQAVGRYGDTLKKIETTLSKETCTELFEQVKMQISWIKEQMQKK